MSRLSWVFMGLVAHLACVTSTGAGQDIPHVDECNLCAACMVDSYDSPSLITLQQASAAAAAATATTAALTTTTTTDRLPDEAAGISQSATSPQHSRQLLNSVRPRLSFIARRNIDGNPHSKFPGAVQPVGTHTGVRSRHADPGTIQPRQATTGQQSSVNEPTLQSTPSARDDTATSAAGHVIVTATTPPKDGQLSTSSSQTTGVLQTHETAGDTAASSQLPRLSNSATITDPAATRPATDTDTGAQGVHGLPHSGMRSTGGLRAAAASTTRTARWSSYTRTGISSTSTSWPTRSNAAKAAAADDVPGSDVWPSHIPRVMSAGDLGPEGTVERLIQVDKRSSRAHLPNCTVCRGCNAHLHDISTEVRQFLPNVRFMHTPGASPTWTLVARPYGSSTRYIVKVFCLPFRKADFSVPSTVSQVRGQDAATWLGKAGAARRAGSSQSNRVRCGLRTYEARVRSLLAQQEILSDCGASEISPKMWLAPLSAMLPGTGYHIRAWALWMEEARGITLHGLRAAHADKLAHELLAVKLNHTQVVMASVWDLLTSQCDRHSENIFIDTQGNLQVIDNDKAMGAVPGCGYDSMLLPGSRYHSHLRTGPYSPIAAWYKRRVDDTQLCHGPVNPLFVVDYRCGAGSLRVPASPALFGVTVRQPATLNATYPAAFPRCMRRMSDMGAAGIMRQYGLTDSVAALTLHTRSVDLLTQGFEWTLHHGRPVNAPRFVMREQPACCGLSMGCDGQHAAFRMIAPYMWLPRSKDNSEGRTARWTMDATPGRSPTASYSSGGSEDNEVSREHSGVPVPATQQEGLQNPAVLNSAALSEPRVSADARLRARSSYRAPTHPVCQVPGCNKDLSACRGYHQRYKICDEHFRVTSMELDGQMVRFCQQCGKFQPLSDFHDERRSCTVQLALHAGRRRKRHAAARARKVMMRDQGMISGSEDSEDGQQGARRVRHAGGASGHGTRSYSITGLTEDELHMLRDVLRERKELSSSTTSMSAALSALTSLSAGAAGPGASDPMGLLPPAHFTTMSGTPGTLLSSLPLAPLPGAPYALDLSVHAAPAEGFPAAPMPMPAGTHEAGYFPGMLVLDGGKAAAAARHSVPSGKLVRSYQNSVDSTATLATLATAPGTGSSQLMPPGVLSHASSGERASGSISAEAGTVGAQSGLGGGVMVVAKVMTGSPPPPDTKECAHNADFKASSLCLSGDGSHQTGKPAVLPAPQQQQQQPTPEVDRAAGRRPAAGENSDTCEQQSALATAGSAGSGELVAGSQVLHFMQPADVHGMQQLTYLPAPAPLTLDGGVRGRPGAWQGPAAAAAAGQQLQFFQWGNSNGQQLSLAPQLPGQLPPQLRMQQMNPSVQYKVVHLGGATHGGLQVVPGGPGMPPQLSFFPSNLVPAGSLSYM